MQSSFFRLLSQATAALAILTSSCASRYLDPDVGKGSSVADPAFPVKIAHTAETAWTEGNEVRTLVNGDAYYPPMLQAIEAARHSITFETFAYVDGPVTRLFTQALAKKAREGVPVLMILDDIGSHHMGKDNEAILRNAGVRLHLYHPWPSWRLIKTNNRTHRKILVVDGQVGFTGGAGFALAWEGNAHSPERWRDTQYEISGPSVAQLQFAFAENWRELTGETLSGPVFFPPLTRAGPHRAQFVFDSPRTPTNPIAHTFLHAIHSAQDSLLLEQSYFVPNATFREALIAAARRGVRVEILMPCDKIDSPFCRYASQNYWPDLLQAGVRLFEYTPTMMHGKLLIADGRLSIVGSGNMDDRSFYINDEVNLHVFCPTFAAEQEAMFLQDRQQAMEITLENLSQFLAPQPYRILARLAAPQL